MKKAEIKDGPIRRGGLGAALAARSSGVNGAKSCILGISRHLKLPKENTIFYIKL